ncbi:MAG: glycosyltransferase family 2 protein [Acidobacteria bacterium]|nr:MAG: glycosyltransferase family 2 protein [Acidobacteriota bacterium]
MPDPQSTAPRVAAIVLNYNGPQITIETVESLLRMDYPRLDVVVVDNGSTDDSYERVAAAFPQITQLRIERNQGISPGINLGLCWALEHGHDYVLVLNNDIEADRDMLKELVAVAESDPSIGVVGPKTYYHADPQRLWSAGGMLRFKESVTRERGDGELDRGQYDRDEEVDYVNGCAMLMRRQALVATGLWHPLYFLGVEDADWCMRMKQQGFRCFYAHRAKLWHKVSFSVGVYKPGRTYHTGRSTAIFVRKYATPRQWLTFLLFYAASIPVAYVRELLKGNQKAVVQKLKGVIEGLRVPMTAPPPLAS